MEKMVTIKESEYRALLKADLKLSILETDGVDNWSGYMCDYGEIMVNEYARLAGFTKFAYHTEFVIGFEDIVDLEVKKENDHIYSVLNINDDKYGSLDHEGNLIYLDTQVYEGIDVANKVLSELTEMGHNVLVTIGGR